MVSIIDLELYNYVYNQMIDEVVLVFIGLVILFMLLKLLRLGDIWI